MATQPTLGQRNIINFQDTPWFFMEDVIPKKPINRTKKEISLESKPVIYPALLQGLQYISDPEWQEIINKAAHGVFPMGYSQRRDGLSYNCCGKRVSIVPDSDPYLAVVQVIEFFRATSGLKTILDREYEKNVITDYVRQSELDYQNQSWSTLSSKAKSQAITDYLDDIAKQMNLNCKERNWLCTIINIGLLNGSIRNSDIEYKNGRLINIKTLKYNQYADSGREKFYCLPPARKTKRNLPKGLHSDQIYLTYPVNNKYNSFKGFKKFWEIYNQQPLNNYTRTSTFTSRITERPHYSSYVDNLVSPYSNRDFTLTPRDITSDFSQSSLLHNNLPSEAELKAQPQLLLLSPRYELHSKLSDQNDQALTFPLQDDLTLGLDQRISKKSTNRLLILSLRPNNVN